MEVIKRGLVDRVTRPPVDLVVIDPEPADRIARVKGADSVARVGTDGTRVKAISSITSHQNRLSDATDRQATRPIYVRQSKGYKDSQIVWFTN